MMEKEKILERIRYLENFIIEIKEIKDWYVWYEWEIQQAEEEIKRLNNN